MAVGGKLRPGAFDSWPNSENLPDQVPLIVRQPNNPCAGRAGVVVSWWDSRSAVAGTNELGSSPSGTVKTFELGSTTKNGCYLEHSESFMSDSLCISPFILVWTEVPWLRAFRCLTIFSKGHTSKSGRERSELLMHTLKRWADWGWINVPTRKAHKASCDILFKF
nr:hypothetical protein Iba_chr01fCG2660 [Ipomoea batatas]